MPNAAPDSTPPPATGGPDTHGEKQPAAKLPKVDLTPDAQNGSAGFEVVGVADDVAGVLPPRPEGADPAFVLPLTPPSNADDVRQIVAEEDGNPDDAARIEVADDDGGPSGTSPDPNGTRTFNPAADDDLHQIADPDDPDAAPGARRISPYTLDPSPVHCSKQKTDVAPGCFYEMDIEIGTQTRAGGELASATAVVRLKMNGNNIGESCPELRGLNSDADISFGVTLKLPQDPAQRGAFIEQFKQNLQAHFMENLNGVRMNGPEPSSLFQSPVVGALLKGGHLERVWGENFALKGENLTNVALGVPGQWCRHVVVAGCQADGLQVQGKLNEVFLLGTEKEAMSARHMVFNPETVEGRCSLRHVTASWGRFAGDIKGLSIHSSNIRGADLSAARGKLVDFENDPGTAAQQLDLSIYDETTKWPPGMKAHIARFEATHVIPVASHLTTDEHRLRDMSKESFVNALRGSPAFSVRVNDDGTIDVSLPSGERGQIALKELPRGLPNGRTEHDIGAQYVETTKVGNRDPIPAMTLDRFWDEFVKRIHQWEARADVDRITRLLEAIKRRDQDAQDEADRRAQAAAAAAAASGSARPAPSASAPSGPQPRSTPDPAAVAP